MTASARPSAGSIVLGLASGGRSVAGLAAVSTSPAGPSATGLAGSLVGRRGRQVLPLLLLGELVADKLPGTPSRLKPPALAVRAVTGAVSSYALARRQRVPGALPALAGAAAAVLGSALGFRWRAVAAHRGWPELVAALAEDAVVLGAAGAVVRS